MTEESKDSKCFVAFCDVCGVLESAVDILKNQFVLMLLHQV